jgi:REP element-mobilizing transposase RayT
MVQKTVIIVTPYQEFGELISHSLHKNLAWKVDAACNSRTVTDLIYNYQSLDYALLDMELSFEQVRESVFIIRDKFPGIEITLISKNEPPEDAEDLRPWKLLTKPFIESDLLELFKYSNASQSNIVIDGNCNDEFDKSLPIWARDSVAIKKIMINSIAHLDAQEAILFINKTVFAQTGTIKAEDAYHCSNIVHEHLHNNETGEVIKQINVNSNSYLLHATILAVGIILAILYRPDTSYKDIRFQTKYLETSLLNPKLSSISLDSLPENARMRSEKSTQTVGSGSSDFSSPQVLHSPYGALFSKVEPKNGRISGLQSIHDFSHLYYSCLLIPRFRSHYITNDLAKFLEEEVPSIFQANGWRLEALILDEQYMMWIVLIPPTIALTSHINIIRKESSKLILKNFVKLSMDGIITDFWAPGYFLGSGNQKISDRDIAEFIYVNRQHYYPEEGNNRISDSKFYTLN